MSMGYHKNYRSSSRASPGIGWSVILIMSLVAVVLALPALALGIVLQRLTSARPWSFPLWLQDDHSSIDGLRASHQEASRRYRSMEYFSTLVRNLASMGTNIGYDTYHCILAHTGKQWEW